FILQRKLSSSVGALVGSAKRARRAARGERNLQRFSTPPQSAHESIGNAHRTPPAAAHRYPPPLRRHPAAGGGGAGRGGGGPGGSGGGQRGGRIGPAQERCRVGPACSGPALHCAR